MARSMIRLNGKRATLAIVRLQVWLLQSDGARNNKEKMKMAVEAKTGRVVRKATAWYANGGRIMPPRKGSETPASPLSVEIQGRRLEALLCPESCLD